MTTEQLALDLFDAPPDVLQGDVDIARGGLGHFRDQMARYARSWPYLIPEWQSWIDYFEHMQRYGFEAAQRLKPRGEESEPSQICGAMTARHKSPNVGAKRGQTAAQE